MATTISAVPFNGTKEQEQKLIELIAAHKGQRGALMPVLQGAQEIYGYLPIVNLLVIIRTLIQVGIQTSYCIRCGPIIPIPKQS